MPWKSWNRLLRWINYLIFIIGGVVANSPPFFLTTHFFYMKENLIASLRQAIIDKPNDRHTHTELAALIRRQFPAAKMEVDAIMNERYNPPSAPSGMKTYVHPTLRNRTVEKKNIAGLVAAEAVANAAVKSDEFVSPVKVMNTPKPVAPVPTTTVDPELVLSMDIEAFLDYFKTSKAIKEYAKAIGIVDPKGDNFSLFDQIQNRLAQ